VIDRPLGPFLRWTTPFLSVTAATVVACGSSPTSTGLAGNACSPSSTAQSAASSQIVACDAGTLVSVAGGGASYIVIPQFAVGDVTYAPTTYSISVNSGGSSVSRMPPPIAGPMMLRAGGDGPSPSFPGGGEAQRRFDSRLLALSHKFATEARLNGRSGMARTRPSFAVNCCPPAGSIRHFHVVSNDNGTAFKPVDARLSYVGTNVLVYVDTLSPPGFSPSQLQTFGQFTDQTLYPLDSIFGQPTDIDNNGHVIMLLTPVVNELVTAAQCSTQGFVGGLFFGHDLVATDTTSNQGEIFYGVVPDSMGTVSCAHPVSALLPCPQSAQQPGGCGFILNVFLHELQHLINFSNHVLITGGPEEEGWVDEGESIIAEEQGSIFFEKRYPPPSGRSSSAQLFPDSAQGFLNFLSQFPGYLVRPDTQSVTLHSDADGGLSWRGGDWLLLRWLGDQYGNGYYKTLEHDIETGTANIAFAAGSGQSFQSLFGNFGVALYADSLPGLPRTTVAMNNRFVTRNIRQLTNRLFQNQELSSSFPLPVKQLTATPITATLVPGTSAYYRLDTSSQGTVQISFSSTTSGTPLPASLHPQLAIFRLPPGS